MIIEIINTGSELMLGFVLNTHQQWLCRQLADVGYTVTRQVAVADTGLAIQAAVRESLTRADFVIVTGGLGPTSDDLTRDLIAELLGRNLRLDEGIAAGLRAFFARRGRNMPETTLVQAQVPEGAEVLPNPNGTAPGLALTVAPNPFRPGGRLSRLIMLPGPPREMRPMFLAEVLPMLQREFPLADPFVCRTLRTTGIGESFAEDRIRGPLQPLVAAGLELGYCAHYGSVDVRIVTRGRAAESLAAEAEAIIRSQLGAHVFGTQDDELPGTVVALLTERRETLVLAESCTGGYIANQITNVPGASAVLLAGLVTYSDAAKQSLLAVREETLAAHGAVSEATVRQMAEGARARLRADYALAVTGIAGPGGGSEAKPVGTVFIALATARQTLVLNPTNRYDRATFKIVTCQQALELLRRNLLGE